MRTPGPHLGSWEEGSPAELSPVLVLRLGRVQSASQDDSRASPANALKPLQRRRHCVQSPSGRKALHPRATSNYRAPHRSGRRFPALTQVRRVGPWGTEPWLGGLSLWKAHQRPLLHPSSPSPPPPPPSLQGRRKGEAGCRELLPNIRELQKDRVPRSSRLEFGAKQTKAEDLIFMKRLR